MEVIVETPKGCSVKAEGKKLTILNHLNSQQAVDLIK